VAANRRLRALLAQRAAADGLLWRVAPLAWCTDNAAMVGAAACQRFAEGCRSSIRLGVAPRLPLAEAGRLYASEACF
jgi:N6-L-threonylcarbamoyladenine synthase